MKIQRAFIKLEAIDFRIIYIFQVLGVEPLPRLLIL